MSTPIDLGSDLLGWWPNSAFDPYSEGDTISRYSDASDFKNHFLSAVDQIDLPTVHVSEYNGLKCLRFDGAIVDSALGQNAAFSEGSNWAISIALFLPSISGSSHDIFVTTNNQNIYITYRPGDTTFRTFIGTTGGGLEIFDKSGSSPVDHFYILTIHWDSTNGLTWRLNRSDVTSVNYLEDDGGDTESDGGTGQIGPYGDFFDFVLYNYSSANITLIEDYLYDTYAVDPNINLDPITITGRSAISSSFTKTLSKTLIGVASISASLTKKQFIFRELAGSSTLSNSFSKTESQLLTGNSTLAISIIINKFISTTLTGIATLTETINIRKFTSQSLVGNSSLTVTINNVKFVSQSLVGNSTLAFTWNYSFGKTLTGIASLSVTSQLSLWTPKMLGSNLYDWWHADKLIGYTNNQNMDLWPDDSGHANDLATVGSTNHPQWIKSFYNNKPAVTFISNKNTQMLSVNVLGESNNWAISMALYVNEDGYRTILESTKIILEYNKTLTSFYAEIKSGTVQDVSWTKSGSAPSTAFRIVTIAYNVTTHERYRVDQSEITGLTYGAHTYGSIWVSDGQLTMGSVGAALSAHIYDTVVYELSDTNITHVEQYLYNIWNSIYTSLVDTLIGNSSLIDIVNVRKFISLTLTGIATLTNTVNVKKFVSTTLTGQATWSTPVISKSYSKTLIGNSTLSNYINVFQYTNQNLTGNSTLSISVIRTVTLAKTLTGIATFSASINLDDQVLLSASLVGIATINTLINEIKYTSLSLVGLATIQSTLNRRIPIANFLLGMATISNTINIKIPINLSLTGQSSFSANLITNNTIQQNLTGAAILSEILNLREFTQLDLIGNSSLSMVYQINNGLFVNWTGIATINLSSLLIDTLPILGNSPYVIVVDKPTHLPLKDPDDLLDYDIDFSGFLSPIDHILSYRIINDPDITLIAVQILNKRIKLILQGGVSGKTYIFICEMKTDTSRRKTVAFPLQVA
jgi:hypothetical protein